MRRLQETRNCLFCRIVSGELPSHRVYEDDKVSVILDIHPVNRGHALVVTKEHYENVHEIPEDLLARVSVVAKKVAAAEKTVFSPAGIGIVQNNGQAAGQIIFHFHTHVIPKDNETHARYDASDAELAEVAARLREAMGGA